MQIINKLSDLTALKAQKALHFEDILPEVEQDFYRYHQSFSPFDPIDEFSLEEYGPIVILQPGDDLHDLREIGFSPDHDGLFGSHPEFATRLRTTDQTIFKVFILSDNEYITTLFVPKNLDPLLEEWIEIYLDSDDNADEPEPTDHAPF